MKKILFSLFFFSMMIAGAEAQKAACSKPCSKSTASTVACQAKAPSAVSAESSEAAAKLASMDATIEKRTDLTGNVTYVRKETCSHSGAVSFVDVSYDAPSNTFVNVSPMHMEGKASGCNSKAAAAGGKSCCAAKGATATAGKSCCAGKGAALKAEKVKS